MSAFDNWVVTVRRLTKDPNHDPKNKKTGECHWSKHCTDVTGEHHSFTMRGTEEMVRDAVGAMNDWRLTRMERI